MDEGVMIGTDMKVAETPKDGLKDFVTNDGYQEWLEKEGVKVYEDFYFPSLAKMELGPWERKGGSGAVVHIKNKNMPNDCPDRGASREARWSRRGTGGARRRCH